MGSPGPRPRPDRTDRGPTGGHPRRPRDRDGSRAADALGRRPRDRPSRRDRRGGRRPDPGRDPADLRRLPGARADPTARSSRWRAFGRPVRVATTFAVPWTSERISDEGRRRLSQAGIAPPGSLANVPLSGLISLDPRVACPSAVERIDNLRSARPSAGRSATARTAASRSKRSSRSDRGAPPAGRLGHPRRRRRRCRDDGRRHRPGRARSRPRGRAVTTSSRAAIERARARIREGLARRAAKLELDGDSIDDWVAGRLAGSAGRAGPRCSRCRGRHRHRGRAPRTWPEAGDLPGPRRGDRGGVILATNTSALSVASIATAARRPDRVLGLHFFNPAPVMALVEVVAAPATEPAVVERATALMSAWGKTPVRWRQPRLHRQPGQPPVHARGAPDARVRGRLGRVRGQRRCAICGFPDRARSN